MALSGKIAVSSALLLFSTACLATGSIQSQPAPETAASVDSQQADEQQATATQSASPIQAATDQASTDQASTDQASTDQAAAGQKATDQAATGQAATDQTATTTGQPAPAATTPASAQPAAGEPAAYVPKTEHDNTPWRFNMKQDGKNMTADQFDAWLKSKGVRVATGKPATPLVQNCPTPEGDKGDNDGDRIINCLDQCPDSEAGQTIGPDGCPVAVAIDLKGVTFGYDKAVLNAEAKSVLDEAVEILTRHPTLKVEVAGHTDARGDAGYNQKLSERRAQAVYDYLVEAGIGEVRLIGPNGYGETRPLLPNKNPDGSDNPGNRAKNRRVELNIQN